MFLGGGAGRPRYGGPPPDPQTADRIRRLCLESRKRPDPGRLIDDHCFVAIDTETTGFSPRGGDEIISLGAVRLERGQVRTDAVFHRLVDPFRPIPPEITRLTGISPAMVNGQDDIFTVLADFLEYAQNSILIGHYISFDLDFINEKLESVCGTRLRPTVLDTCVISRAVYPKRTSHSLDSLLDFHCLEPKGRHTALGDAILTADLFQALMLRVRKHGVFSLSDLNLFLEQRLDYFSHAGYKL